MHVEPRYAPIEKIVVHVNVGPEVEGGAAGLARYLHTISGGYHQIVDDKSAVQVAPDNIVVWGASGMNARGLHLAFIGMADQTLPEWTDAYSLGEMDRAAYVAAVWCSEYGIPARHLTTGEVRTNGVKGICGHVDVTHAFGGSNDGHSDPGPNFPWTLFLAKVNAFLKPPAPTPPPTPIPVPPKPPAPTKHAQYEPPLPVASVWKRAGGDVIAGVSPEGKVFAWGPEAVKAHGPNRDQEPYGKPYWLDGNPNRKAVLIRAWKEGDFLVNGNPGVYTIISNDFKAYSYGEATA